MGVDPQISEICRRAKVSDYLVSKGVEIVRRGRKVSCCCPLPTHGHKEKTPSFFISTTPDGTELFKCFGCGQFGNIITVMRIMEGETKNGPIIGRLARSLSMKLGVYDEATVIEPLSETVLASMCNEDQLSFRISAYAIGFLEAHGRSDDSINKISEVYKAMDDMIERGDNRALQKTLELLIAVSGSYKALPCVNEPRKR